MILEIGFNNYKMFKNKSAISLKIDKRTKYLLSNSVDVNNVSVMKALAIYGPNNAGKSNLIKLFEMIKNVLIGDMEFSCNNYIFNDQPNCSAYIIYNNNDEKGWFKYEFEYDSFKKNFISEKLSRVTYYPNGAPFLSVLFEKNNENKMLKVYDEDNSQLLQILPSDKPFLYTVQLENGKFSNLLELKESLAKCSNSIEILKMFNIEIAKTISAFKSNDEKRIKFITSFVKAADLSITDFGYSDDIKIVLDEKDVKIDEKALNEYKHLEEKLKLHTSYGKTQVPSFFFDSSGTKKIEAIASYIYEAIMDGKLLIVDELDNGLHFSLTRAIVSLFNNMANKRGQLIFTAHDLLLIDCKNLLRKDQIYFLSRNEETSSIMSLKSVTANGDGLREGDNLLKRYNHGDFGAVPLPGFIKELIMLISKKSGWK